MRVVSFLIQSPAKAKLSHLLDTWQREKTFSPHIVHAMRDGIRKIEAEADAAAAARRRAPRHDQYYGNGRVASHDAPLHYDRGVSAGFKVRVVDCARVFLRSWGAGTLSAVVFSGGAAPTHGFAWRIRRAWLIRCTPTRVHRAVLQRAQCSPTTSHGLQLPCPRTCGLLSRPGASAVPPLRCAPASILVATAANTFWRVAPAASAGSACRSGIRP